MHGGAKHAGRSLRRHRGGRGLLGDGEVIEVEPPRRLVHTMRALWDDEVRNEGFSRVTTVSRRRIVTNTITKEIQMFNRLVFTLLATVLFAGLLPAHGDPIMGTVTAVTSDTFTIKDKDNKPVVIMLEKATKFLINDKPAKKADLKVGVRVVIDAHMDTKMKMYSAEEVNIGNAPVKK